MCSFQFLEVLLLPTLLDVVYVSSGVLLLTFVPSGTTWIMLNPIYSFCIFGTCAYQSLARQRKHPLLDILLIMFLFTGTGVSIKLLLSDYSKVSDRPVSSVYVTLCRCHPATIDLCWGYLLGFPRFLLSASASLIKVFLSLCYRK